MKKKENKHFYKVPFVVSHNSHLPLFRCKCEFPLWGRYSTISRRDFIGQCILIMKFFSIFHALHFALCIFMTIQWKWQRQGDDTMMIIMTTTNDDDNGRTIIKMKSHQNKIITVYHCISTSFVIDRPKKNIFKRKRASVQAKKKRGILLIEMTRSAHEFVSIACTYGREFGSRCR